MSNILSEVHPELVAEWSDKNLPLTPDRITYGSNKVVWWKGACGHEWQTSVKARSNGENCPICSGARVIEGINDLATLKPELADEWSSKNDPLKPTMVTTGSHKKVIWQDKYGHEWTATVKSRALNGTGCPYCSHNKILVGFNDLASQRPQIASEWSERNYPLKPDMVTVFANRKVWWRCSKGHEWNTLISTRSGGSGCPYCSGQLLLKGFNDFATTHPQLAQEWSDRNLPFTPDMINEKSRRNVWWKCRECGYEWQSVVYARVKGTVCPVCADRAVMTGYNDLATTDAHLLPEWDYEKNKDISPNKISRHSMQSVWWKCSLGHSWKAKISEKAIEGKGCKVCEKDYLTVFPKLAVMYYAAKKRIKVQTDTDKIIGIPLEIYFPEEKAAIETVSQTEKVETLKAYLAKDRADEMLRQAEHIAAENTLPPDERFFVIETDEGYAIWDDLTEAIYIDDEGVSEEFKSEWQANDYLEQVKKSVSEKEAAEWLYVERAKQNTSAEQPEQKEAEPFTPAFSQPKRSRVQTFDLHPEIPLSERHTFDLASHEVPEAGKKERFRRNMEAIRVLKECEFDNRFATPEEQEILSQYVGWGGIPEAFDENNSSWANEFIELYTALSPDEYESARASTLTAFYTPPVVISSIYKAMEQMGFCEGNILEPSCGIGNFIGMLPQSMQDSKIYGVEIDKISAGIAQQLYQETSIAAQPFEEANIPDSFFDAVIGNVPFGDIRVNDRRYNKHNFLIHDYFFAKSLDKLRPGGVMALITSKGTMDKESPAVRKYIAQRADLLGAIRLPNNTFKGNAGTEVVSDILILQKRDRLIDLEPEWVHLSTDENGVKMNTYFVDHPEMVLGEWKTVSGRFGEEDTVVPYENADLAELLEEAISNIHAEITDYEVDEELTEEDNSIPADPEVRNFSYTVVDDKIYYRENSRMAPVDVSATAENRIKGMIAIRDCVRNLIEMQTADYPDYEVEKEQQKLNELYDTFSKKYGLINSRANVSAFSQDSSFALLSALEVLDENGELERKADMFTKRTIKPHTPVTSVDTASEALAVSMGEKAQVDMEYMCSLTGKTEEEVYQELKGVIFLNPVYGYGGSDEQKYLMADEYLSGNVREKLAWAKKSAEVYPEDYKINVEALEKVQPKDLTASEIFVQLGTTWLPEEIAQQFMYEFLDTPVYARWNIKVHYSKLTGEWNVEGKSYDRGNLKAYNTYGTKRVNAYKIIEDKALGQCSDLRSSYEQRLDVRRP